MPVPFVFVPCHASQLLTCGSIGQILIIAIHGALPKTTVRNTNAPLQCKVPKLIKDAIAVPKWQHQPWCHGRVCSTLAPRRCTSRLLGPKLLFQLQDGRISDADRAMLIKSLPLHAQTQAEQRDIAGVYRESGWVEDTVNRRDRVRLGKSPRIRKSQSISQ